LSLSVSKDVSDRQIAEMYRLAKELRWDYAGESHQGDEYLRWRLERFAASKTGSRDAQAVRILESLTGKEASNIIRGLRAILQKESSASSSK